MPIIYRSKKIIPAPLVGIGVQHFKPQGVGSKGYDNQGGIFNTNFVDNLGATYTITLQGTLVADMGSPKSYFEDDDDAATPLLDKASTTINPSTEQEYIDALFTDRTAAANPQSEDLTTISGRGTIDPMFQSILQKQEAIRKLFGEDGHLFEIRTYDGVRPFKCYPQVAGIEFSDPTPGDNWVQICRYTITLVTDKIIGLTNVTEDGTDDSLVDADGQRIHLEAAQENWSLELGDDYGVTDEIQAQYYSDEGIAKDNTQNDHRMGLKVYTLTHTLSATGKKVFTDDENKSGQLAAPGENKLLPNSEGTPAYRNVFKPVTAGHAWEQARQWVQSKLVDNVEELLDDNSFLSQFRESMSHRPGVFTDLLGSNFDYNAYDHARTEEKDEFAGTYAITETWVIALHDYTESFSIDVSESVDDPIKKVSIKGSIRGLDTHDRGWSHDVRLQKTGTKAGYPNEQQTGFGQSFGSAWASRSSGLMSQAFLKSKWTAASGRFEELKYLEGSSLNAIYQRVKLYSRVNALTPQVKSKTFTIDPPNGTIEYTYNFDTKPGPCLSGALRDNISFSWTHPKDQYASIPVIGRRIGPVLQNINTKADASKVAVNIEAILPIATGQCMATNCESNGWPNFRNLFAIPTFNTGPGADTNLNKSGDGQCRGVSRDADNIVNQLRAFLVKNQGNTVFLESDSEAWDPFTGKFSRNVTFVYQRCGEVPASARNTPDGGGRDWAGGSYDCFDKDDDCANVDDCACE